MILAEQVAGRSRRMIFVTHAPSDTAKVLLDDLCTAFAGNGLHYSEIPIADFRRLG
jgi:hypothetical protein